MHVVTITAPHRSHGTASETNYVPNRVLVVTITAPHRPHGTASEMNYVPNRVLVVTITAPHRPRGTASEVNYVPNRVLVVTITAPHRPHGTASEMSYVPNRAHKGFVILGQSLHRIDHEELCSRPCPHRICGPRTITAPHRHMNCIRDELCSKSCQRIFHPWTLTASYRPRRTAPHRHMELHQR